MNDFRLSVLKPRYEQLFNSCLLRSSWLSRISFIAEQILSQRGQYDAVEAQTAVPWWFVGILHYRDLNFRSAHLHNGDPLTNRTINAPQGYPLAPPINGISYTFVESAIDVLRLKKFDKAKDKSIAAWLWRFEGWNGFSYANMGINSEYLWNGTNHFGSGNNRGMFLTNGQFDPAAKSEQAGTAALVWYMHYQGIITQDDQQPQLMASQSADNWSMSFDTTASGNGSINNTINNTVQTLSPFAVQSSATMQMADAFRYYQQLPHQEQAIAWLQQQLSLDLLTEFTRRWEDNSAAAATPFAAAAVAEQNVITQNWGMASNTLSVATPTINHVPPPPPPPPPVVQPKRTLAESIIAYCQDKGYTIDRGVGEKNIIYIEGMYPDGRLNDDAFNAWNDARLVIEFQNGLPVILKAWEATTEPGQYYTMQPMNLSGAARIAFGQYKSWQVGTHGQADPHEALIQTGGAVTVYRDLNKDGLRTGDRTETGYFGINQHWGGDSPASDIGAWSAGCLVGRTRDGHREFMALCKQDPRYIQNRGYVFHATVIPGDDLFKRYPPTIVNQATPAAAINPPSPPQTTTSGTTGTAHPPLQSLNQAILQAALALKGMSTADGPDGGNNACAWSLNRVLAKAGIPPLGENPNYVPSLVDDLKGGRGQLVNSIEAKPGDLVIADGEAHIGVGLDENCATVLSNSSSRAAFKWESGRDFDGAYGGPSTIYRLLK